MSDPREREAQLRAAFFAGFGGSMEGFNGEYTGDDDGTEELERLFALWLSGGSDDDDPPADAEAMTGERSGGPTIDLSSLGDDHLQTLGRAFYAAEGEGALGTRADLEFARAVAAEASKRGIDFELPWEHGTMTASTWLNGFEPFAGQEEDDAK